MEPSPLEKDWAAKSSGGQAGSAGGTDSLEIHGDTFACVCRPGLFYLIVLPIKICLAGSSFGLPAISSTEGQKFDIINKTD